MAISLGALGVNVDRLYHGQPSLTGETIYTAPGTPGAGRRTQVSSVKIANPAPSAMTVRLGLVPAGATADGTHYLLADLSIPANSTYESDVKFILRAGDALEGQSASLPAPTFPTVAVSSSGGTLAAGSYYYRMSATNPTGESLSCMEVTATTSGGTSSVTLAWTRMLGASGYRIYRGTTSGANILLATITSGATTTYTDTGNATTSGTPASLGTASACIFTISGAELPA